MSCVLPDHFSASRPRQFPPLVSRNATRLSALVTSALLVAVVLCQTADAQLGVLNRGNRRSRINRDTTVFTGLTRQLLRPLRLAEAAIEEENFEQACLLIGEILDDDELKDCLVPDEQDWGYAISLRQKALKLLGTLDEDQRSAYRDKYATRSNALLKKAIEDRDYAAIEFVSERYLYTDAGLEATMLLGHHWLNQGRPETSANAFGKLLKIPRGQQLYDPELTLLSAISNALSNQEETAVSHLERLKEMDVAKLAFFQRDVSIYTETQQPLEWLKSLIGDLPLKSKATVRQWLMWQGNPQRNSETTPGFPLYSPRWSSKTLGQYESSVELENWMDMMVKNRVAPVPKMNLLTVGNTIVVRTAETMLGIDAATGKRRWRFPGVEAKLTGSYLDPKRLSRTSPQSIEAGPQGTRHQAGRAKYYERVLQDTIFSQIASDGKLVFCIPNPGIATTGDNWQKHQHNRFEAPTDLREFNELCGINVAAEGALVWQVGGVSGGDESKLARTFFLGSPLPLDGSLFCICVQDQLIKLVVLDSRNGSLQWEKELATTEDTVDFKKNVVRRLAGATPSACDGIVVCPTGLSAIVAVDIGTRSLKWGFQFSKPNRINTRITHENGKPWEAYENVWRDTSLKIADGSVVYTPANSRELCCIDLRTGRSRWNTSSKKPDTLKRDGAMYVAAVRNSEIILVSPGELRGADIATGQIAWKIPFDEHGIVSGHGYAHGNHYYLPTTSKKLVQFDLSEGKKTVSKVVNTDCVLGNLYPWNADIISVGLDHIAAYPCDFTSRQFVSITDTDQQALDSIRWKPHTRLAIKAQLEMQRGNYSDAAQLISEAYDLFPNSSYAGVLVEVLTEMIAIDFKQAEAIFQRYKDLFKERDLQRLLQGKVNGLIKTLRYEEAFETLLEIASEIKFSDQNSFKPGAEIDGNELVELNAADIDLSPPTSDSSRNGVVEISRTSWLRWQLSLLASRVIAKSKLTPENQLTKTDLTVVIAEHLASFEQENVDYFFQRLQLFPRELIAPALIVKTGQRLLESKRRIEAKNLLLNTWSDQDADPEVIAHRLELLSQIAIDQQDLLAAKSFVNRLGKLSPKANTVAVKRLRQKTESLETSIQDNIYDEQLYLKLARNKSHLRGPRHQTGRVNWKTRVAQIGKAEHVPFGEGRHNCVIVETDVQELRKLVFRYEATRGELQVHDSLGRLARSVYLRPNGELDSVASGTMGKTGKIFLKNSVMLFCFGREIFALDWISMVRGKAPVMWSIRLEQGTSTRNVFGGPRANGVCFLDGSELKCVDLFTGQTRWVRNRVPSSSVVREGGDRITVWNDSDQLYETFDKLSGRRIAGNKIDKLINSTSTGHNQFHLFQILTGGKPNDESSEGQTKTPDDPFFDEPSARVAYTQLKLQMFDFEVGEVAWERTFPLPTVFQKVDETSIAVLGGDGTLSLLDLPTGKVQFEQKIDGLEDFAFLRLSVIPMAQGYICIASRSDGSSKVKLDEDTNVKFSRLKSRDWLGSGYIFAVDRETGEALWSKPVQVDSFELVNGTPYDSPLLMLIRRAEYSSTDGGVNKSKNSKQRIQVAMLDVATGQLRANHLIKETTVGREPRLQIICRPGKEYQDTPEAPANQKDDDPSHTDSQRLELLISSKRYRVQLADSTEETDSKAPAILTNDSSTVKIDDRTNKVAENKDSDLVVDLEPVAQKAKEAYQAMLELGKVEAELFEKQRKQEQRQR